MDNTDRIREKVSEQGLDAVLITGELNQRYAAGFPFTDGAVLITEKRCVLFTDSRYIEAAERAVGPETELRLFGAGKRLSELVKQVLTEDGVDSLGAEFSSMTHADYLMWSERLGTELKNADSIFSSLRASKTEEDQENMRLAQRIAERALEDVLGIIRVGITERDIAAEISYRLLRHGGEGNSFEPIAVTGRNTSMPHGVPSDAAVKSGDFITMDFGCIKNGYCSDMTRTVAVGSVSDEMKNVYEVVLSAQRAGIAAAKAGVNGKEIDGAARGVIEAAGYGEYFGHSFGHSLGLYIHESPSASPMCEAPMPEGAVISAEPGIYLPGRFGVRIEDVLILRRDGNENITRAPKELLIL